MSYTAPQAWPAPRGAERPIFTFADVIGSLFVGLLLPTAFLVTWMFGTHAAGGSRSLVFAAIPLWAAVSASLLYLLLKRRRRLSASDLGFKKPARSWWHLAWVVPATITGSALMAALAGATLGITKPTESSSDTLSGLGINMPVTVGIALTTTLAAPLLEEIIFRGVLLGYLRQKWCPALAVVACTVVFGLCHVAPQIMLYVVPLGLCLALVRLWFDSMWPNIALHVLNNTLVTAIALSVIT